MPTLHCYSNTQSCVCGIGGRQFKHHCEWPHISMFFVISDVTAESAQDKVYDEITTLYPCTEQHSSQQPEWWHCLVLVQQKASVQQCVLSVALWTTWAVTDSLGCLKSVFECSPSCLRDCSEMVYNDHITLKMVTRPQKHTIHAFNPSDTDHGLSWRNLVTSWPRSLGMRDQPTTYLLQWLPVAVQLQCWVPQTSWPAHTQPLSSWPICLDLTRGD